MASRQRISSEEVYDMPDQAYQPTTMVFPRRQFGVSNPVNRCFQAAWFNRFKWIHYDSVQDRAFCFVCCKAVRDKKASPSSYTEESFLVKGFTNWKDATRIFVRHESCDFHKISASALASRVNVGDMLWKEAATQKQQNRQYLLKLLSSLRYLARQGLSLRGDGDETDSNLYQLLYLRGEDYPPIHQFLQRQQLKYTAHEVQNELLSIMAQQILRDIAVRIQSAVYYTIMIDETSDCSNKEQVVLVFRWVSEDLVANEEFFGLYLTDSTTSAALVAIIEDTLLRMNIKLEYCRGQCYDGASAMTGARNGVAKTISDKESRAIFTHCYGHALNLGVADTVKQCQLMKSSLDVVIEISKLIKKSPKRDAIFQKLKSDLAPDSPGFRVLCPTRWTVRAASLQSVLDNYQVLFGVWEDALGSKLDGEMRARIIGVDTQMHTFDFLFGISLGCLLLRHTDNLSKSLQSKTLSAAGGQRLASLTLSVLTSLRTEDNFKKFYARVIKDQTSFQVNDPALPRKRRAPQRLQIGSTSGDFHSSPQDRYRQIYYESLDFVVQAVTDRFNQPGYRVYVNLQELLLKACKGEAYEPEMQAVLDVYKDDLSKLELEAQLPLLKPLCSDKDTLSDFSIHDAIEVLSELSVPERSAFSGVWKVLKLLLVLPATNAASERSFSALRRVKTYLRTTMSQERLNHLMVLHIHKDRMDKLELEKVAEEFVTGREGRQRVFGSFV